MTNFDDTPLPIGPARSKLKPRIGPPDSNGSQTPAPRRLRPSQIIGPLEPPVLEKTRIEQLEEEVARLKEQVAERCRVSDDLVGKHRELLQRIDSRTAQLQDAVKAQDAMARFLADSC